MGNQDKHMHKEVAIYQVIKKVKKWIIWNVRRSAVHRKAHFVHRSDRGMDQ
jgi:hypothetical protein